jgi:hypothetical protein
MPILRDMTHPTHTPSCDTAPPVHTAHTAHAVSAGSGSAASAPVSRGIDPVRASEDALIYDVVRRTGLDYGVVLRVLGAFKAAQGRAGDPSL